MLPEVERDICQYIMENQGECFDDVLAKDNRWEVFYHLSEMRTSILSWYDFVENASVLEVGGGFGALTGMLCRHAERVTVTESSCMRADAIRLRYRDRNNLTVYEGEAEDAEFQALFDYVVITGAACDGRGGVSPEEQWERYMKLARKWLKMSGVLLLALDNPNGAKYQCGYPRPEAGSINENGQEIMLTRERLSETVARAGFNHIKFYYPFPDYRLTQEIYTDARLPEGNMRDRALSYYVLPGMLYKDEYELYEKAIENGSIRELCNSYLVECSRQELHSDAEYITVSTDRGRMHSFGTVIGRDQVVKTALYDEGKEYLKESYKNILEIQNRGIKVVSQQYCDDRLVMPVMKGKKLVDWLFLLAVQNKESFLEAVDKLYQCILSSSDSERKNEKIYLKNGYIDMIPFNCFVIGGEYYFFDQEFCEKECALDYIIFRTLRYTYLTHPDLERYACLEDMKKRYGLQNDWEMYLLKEDRFIWDNRQHRVNHCLYKWMENGVVSQPIAKAEGICGLYLFLGFDVLEKNENSSWVWAIKEEAGIYLLNYQDRKIKIKVNFGIYPPPGRVKQRIKICQGEKIGNVIDAPNQFEWREEIEAKEIKHLSFCTLGQPGSCEGDSRSFAFQLLNPILTVE